MEKNVPAGPSINKRKKLKSQKESKYNNRQYFTSKTYGSPFFFSVI